MINLFLKQEFLTDFNYSIITTPTVINIFLFTNNRYISIFTFTSLYSYEKVVMNLFKKW